MPASLAFKFTGVGVWWAGERKCAAGKGKGRVEHGMGRHWVQHGENTWGRMDNDGFAKTDTPGSSTAGQTGHVWAIPDYLGVEKRHVGQGRAR